VPEDNYPFSGEIPWSPEFASEIEYGDGEQMYRNEINVADGPPIEVEILAHDFGWESYHSVLNQAGGAYVPSRLFSRRFDLRGIPQSFDQRLPDGARAAISLRAPAGFEGHLLYLREDLCSSMRLDEDSFGSFGESATFTGIRTRDLIGSSRLTKKWR
jgi:hypothetical protein